MITSPKFYRFAQILTLLVFPTAVACLWFVQVEDKVQVSGLVASSQQETVTSPCDKTLIKTVFVENGDTVEPGQPLVVLQDLQGRRSKLDHLKNRLQQLKELSASLDPNSDTPADLQLNMKGELAKQHALEKSLRSLTPPVSNEMEPTVTSTFHVEINRLKHKETHLRGELSRLVKMVEKGVSPGKKRDDLQFQIEQITRDRQHAELALAEERQRVENELTNSRNRVAKMGAMIISEQTRLGHEIIESELTLEVLKQDLDRLVVTSPFRGRVVDVPAREFQPVSIGTPLVKISGKEPKIITCRVPESRILEVKPNQKVLIKSNLYNFLKHNVYHGVVKHIAPHGIQEEDRVFYEVTISIKEGHDILKVGSAAGCEILVGSSPAIFLLIGRH